MLSKIFPENWHGLLFWAVAFSLMGYAIKHTIAFSAFMFCLSSFNYYRIFLWRR